MHRKRAAGVAAALALAALAAACGGEAGGGEAAPASPVVADQTVEVAMVDLAFRPEEVRVKAGSSVRFVFTNKGRLVHDASFGDEAHQQAVASGREKRNGVAVNPNKARDVVRTFDTPGTVLVGCHQAGHYAAGMKLRVVVE